ncbi:MAG: RNB domain-containing ribonuclease, partial [Opitutales bacterium]|nr:RNB domain-containing ribonuclease [Opitutales bacterium]
EFLATFGITVANLNVRSEVNKLIKILEEHPQGHILKSQLLRSLKKACYRSTPDGHYGLHKRDYCHFTSPIRRYADLAVHRVFDFFLVKFKGRKELHGGTPRYNISRAKTLAEHLSHTEVNSTEAERESVKVKLLEFFERELEKPKKTRFQAVITEVRNHGMFIELVESNAFGMVHISTLKDDLYNVNNSGTALEGRRTRKKYAVGQKINVFVHRVDRFKRQVDFRLSK